MSIRKMPFGLMLCATAVLVSNAVLAGDKNVNVANTPDVNVANTPDVNVANMPDVNVANSPDVNVANVPDVYIINDATSPVPVLDVNNAMVPFQSRLSFSINAGSTQEQIDIPVPAGKRLIIDHVSSRVQGPTGEQYIAQVQTSVFGNGSTRGVHWLVLTPQTSIPGLDIYTASQPMRISAQPSTPSALFIVTRKSSAGTSFAEVTISGSLADL